MLPDQPAAPGAVALLAATAIAIGRWATFAGHQFSAFALIGHMFTNPAGLPGNVVVNSKIGYDGQFYYRLALDPVNLHTTAFGITVDTPYRFLRDGYPALTWLLSAGERSAVPVMLIMVNILAIGAIGYVGGIFARDNGRHALWGLLLAGYYGMITSLSRDTAEPVAAAFLVAGLLLLRESRPGGRRPVLAGILLGYASLTRETAIIAPVVYLVTRLGGIAMRRYRPGRDDLGWLISVTLFGAWQTVIYLATGQIALDVDEGANTDTPFAAPIHAIWWNFTHLNTHWINNVDEWALEFVVLAAVIVFALASLRSTSAPVYERLAFAVYIFEICLVAPTTWNSLTADMRSFIEVWMLGVLILLSSSTRPRQKLLACRLPTVALLLVPALATVIVYRMHGT